MRYRVTCLTPTLIGDGRKLAPIDYMVWRDQVNVLDQSRIFRLLSRGPRLDHYLIQIRKAEKLDFATWGGFAQNFAGRRIAFEHPTCAQAWEKARPEHLFIPTFVSGPQGFFLPATSLKGALRTSSLLARTEERHLEEFCARCQTDGPPRRPGEALEQMVLGPSSSQRTRALLVSDSRPAPDTRTRVYLLRTATLAARGERLELAWKTSPRGAVDPRRIGDSTPTFAEMAAPGTEFFGDWMVRSAFRNEEMLRALRWREGPSPAQTLQTLNRASGLLLEAQALWAEQAGLTHVAATVAKLRQRLEEVQNSGSSALLVLGWGTGLVGKTTLAGPAAARKLLQAVGAFPAEVRTGLPLPKTRRIVFLQGQPATVPGWVQLDLFEN